MINEIKIPTEFKIGGKIISIEIDNNLDDQDCLGKAYPHLNKIKVCTTYKGEDVPQSSIDHTLYHEIIHLILDNIGRQDLSSDETLVESFSTLLHQVISTIKLLTT